MHMTIYPEAILHEVQSRTLHISRERRRKAKELPARWRYSAPATLPTRHASTTDSSFLLRGPGTQERQYLRHIPRHLSGSCPCCSRPRLDELHSHDCTFGAQPIDSLCVVRKPPKRNDVQVRLRMHMSWTSTWSRLTRLSLSLKQRSSFRGV